MLLRPQTMYARVPARVPGTRYPVGVVWCGAFGVRLRLIFMRIALAYLPIFRAIAKPRLLTLPGDIPPSG